MLSLVPTPAERQALMFVAAVAVLGLGVRGWRAAGQPATPPTDQAALARQLAAVDSAVTAGGQRRATRAARASGEGKVPSVPDGARAPRTVRAAPRDPLRSGAAISPFDPATPGTDSTPIDMDVASAVQLLALPGIGPALAHRIVEDREANGPFGSLAGLERVRGIGPVLVKRLQPHVTFSLPPRPSDTEPRVRARGRHP